MMDRTCANCGVFTHFGLDELGCGGPRCRSEPAVAMRFLEIVMSKIALGSGEKYTKSKPSRTAWNLDVFRCSNCGSREGN